MDQIDMSASATRMLWVYEFRAHMNWQEMLPCSCGTFSILAPIYSILEESLMEPIDMSGPATCVLWLCDSQKERGASYLYLIVPKNALSRRTWVIKFFDFSSIFTLKSHIFWYFGPELNNFFRSGKNTQIAYGQITQWLPSYLSVNAFTGHSSCQQMLPFS